MMLLQLSACLCASGMGAIFSGVLFDAHQRKVRRKQSLNSVNVAAPKKHQNAHQLVFDWWQQCSLEQKARNGPVLVFCRSVFLCRCERWMQREGNLLGNSLLTAQGMSTLCCMFALGGACAVLMVGYGLGAPPALVFVLCVIGCVVASCVPFRVAREYINQRRGAMERELPQMLAMVALGMQSGLSFDRSFALYPTRFTTNFSKECVHVQQRWEMSLASREDALRDFAATYDSPLFKQAIESVIRSLRLGTSLAANLEALSAEARNQYRAACEEKIAKAPVKMLMPTGALILPAMLLLVMGPILLEMMGAS